MYALNFLILRRMYSALPAFKVQSGFDKPLTNGFAGRNLTDNTLWSWDSSVCHSPKSVNR